MKTLARYVGSVFAASLLIFAVMRLIPGDPARVKLGVHATEEDIAELSHQLGTDRPLVVQYASWIGQLLRGDFGTSLASGEPIAPYLADAAQVSLILCVTSMVVALLIAIPAGASRSRVAAVVAELGVAVPSFLAALILVAVFSVRLRWLPSYGWVPPNADVGRFLASLVLPVLSLALVQAAMLTRYIRSAVIDARGLPHLRTARAIGQSPGQALRRHGARSAALPVLTILGVQFTSLIVGAVVIEVMFGIPGIGRLLLNGVLNRDIPMVQNIVMVLVLITLTINLLVDLAYRWLDPRLSAKHGGSRAPGPVAAPGLSTQPSPTAAPTPAKGAQR